jgi:hypothetical protein
MAKNIKLKDLLNEQDPRIAGYKTPSDRYLSKTGPDAQGNYQIDPKLAAVTAKATAKDVTAVKPAISPLKKSPLDRTREEILMDIADIIYKSKGYISDDEQEAYDQITSIKNLADWEFVETYFETEYGKTLSAYLVSNNFFGGLGVGDTDPTGDAAITKKLADWIGRQSWMPQAKKDEYLNLFYDRDIEKVFDPTHGMFGSRGLGTVTNINDVLDLVSLTLDAIPVLGWIASAGIDLLNAAIFVFKGDYYNAGMRTVFAAIPGISGGTAIKLSKDALIKLGEKVAIATEKGANKALKLLPEELAALKFLNKNQVKIANKLVADFANKLTNSATAKKALQGFKNLSKLKQKDLIQSLIAYSSKVSNSAVGKSILDFIASTGVVTAADKALRLASKPSQAEMDAYFKTASTDLAAYFKRMASPLAPKPYVEHVNINLKLTSILAVNNVTTLHEQKEWSYDDAVNKAKKDRAAAKAEESIVGIDDIIYWGTFAAYGIGAYVTYKAGKGLLKSLLGASAKQGWGLLWENGFNFKKWRDALTSKKGIAALEKYGITLTKTEFENMTRACVVRSQAEIDLVLSRVRSGELNPKEAIKLLRNLTPDTMEKEYLALYDIYKTGVQKGSSATQAGAAATSAGTEQAMTRAQWLAQYPNVTPEQFQTLNLSDRYYLQNTNPLAKYNYRTQSIIRK